MPTDLEKRELKSAFKEAIKEWLDEKYADIGHWTLRAFLTAAVGAMVYFILTMTGWHK